MAKKQSSGAAKKAALQRMTVNVSDLKIVKRPKTSAKKGK
jgi:hypothetical protein